MRWSIKGTNYVITLRYMYESNRWNEIEKIYTHSFAMTLSITFKNVSKKFKH